mmetsp:Transcript_11616/g.32307  ORF Transcript_11616/g.32307 Transcript_11616/m.32307 type:complete len:361 (+) Transcript_11616:1462-2544(+)
MYECIFLRSSSCASSTELRSRSLAFLSVSRSVSLSLSLSLVSLSLPPLSLSHSFSLSLSRSRVLASLSLSLDPLAVSAAPTVAASVAASGGRIAADAPEPATEDPRAGPKSPCPEPRLEFSVPNLESCSSRLSKAEEEEDLVGSEGRKDPYAELLAPPNAALPSSESSAKAWSAQDSPLRMERANSSPDSSLTRPWSPPRDGKSFTPIGGFGTLALALVLPLLRGPRKVTSSRSLGTGLGTGAISGAASFPSGFVSSFGSARFPQPRPPAGTKLTVGSRPWFSAFKLLSCTGLGGSNLAVVFFSLPGKVSATSPRAGGGFAVPTTGRGLCKALRLILENFDLRFPFGAFFVVIGIRLWRG